MTSPHAAGRWYAAIVRAPVAIPMAIGVVLRLILVATGSGTERFSFADTSSYLVVAEGLPGALWGPDAELVTATLWRTPMYPLFAWASGGGSNLTWIVLAQCLVGGALNVWLAYRLGRALFGAFVGLVAAAVCAVDPATIAHNLLVATETLTTTFVLLLLLATHQALARLQRNEPATRWALAAGLMGAFLALTRPNLLLLGPAVAVYLALATRSRRGLGMAAVALLGAVVPVAAWVVRNDRVAGAPVLTTVTGQNLLDFGLAAAATEQGRLALWTTDQEQFAVAIAQVPELRTVSPPQRGDTAAVETNRAWTSEGLEIMQNHPRGVAIVAGTAIVKTTLAPGTGLLEPHLAPGWSSALSRPMRVLGSLYLGVLYLAFAAGVVLLIARRRWADLALLLGTIALYVASSVGPWMYVRFRVPITPLIAVVAGFGATLVRERLAQRRGMPSPRGEPATPGP